jgi:hypothetical protein
MKLGSRIVGLFAVWMALVPASRAAAAVTLTSVTTAAAPTYVSHGLGGPISAR